MGRREQGGLYHQHVQIQPLMDCQAYRPKIRRTVDLRRLTDIRECNVVMTKVVMRLTHQPTSSFVWDSGQFSSVLYLFSCYCSQCTFDGMWKEMLVLPVFLNRQTLMYHMLVYTAGRLFSLLSYHCIYSNTHTHTCIFIFSKKTKNGQNKVTAALLKIRCF